LGLFCFSYSGWSSLVGFPIFFNPKVDIFLLLGGCDGLCPAPPPPPPPPPWSLWPRTACRCGAVHTRPVFPPRTQSPPLCVSETKNPLADGAPGNYLNVSIARPLGPTDLNLLRQVSAVTQGGLCVWWGRRGGVVVCMSLFSVWPVPSHPLCEAFRACPFPPSPPLPPGHPLPHPRPLPFPPMPSQGVVRVTSWMPSSSAYRCWSLSATATAGCSS
jgi:hypothetical protein